MWGGYVIILYNYKLYYKNNINIYGMVSVLFVIII
jgi:hypothetical protein